jgi:hypothetical protein
MHIRTSKIYFALQISLITFKLQGDPPKKKKEAYMYVHGEEGIKSLKRHTTFFGRRFGEE